jgi:hypothetical protein
VVRANGRHRKDHEALDRYHHPLAKPAPTNTVRRMLLHDEAAMDMVKSNVFTKPAGELARPESVEAHRFDPFRRAAYARSDQ